MIRSGPNNLFSDNQFDDDSGLEIENISDLSNDLGPSTAIDQLNTTFINSSAVAR